MCEVCDYIDFWKKHCKEKGEKFDLDYRMFSNISTILFLQGDYEHMIHPASTMVSRNFPLNYCPMCGRKLGVNNEK